MSNVFDAAIADICKSLHRMWYRRTGVIVQGEIENWFKIHTENTEGHKKIAAAAVEFCKTIISNTPACPDQTTAIRKVREGVMTAYAAIDCGGK